MTASFVFPVSLLRWREGFTGVGGGAYTILATKSAPDELFGCGKVLQVGNELGQPGHVPDRYPIDAFSRHNGFCQCSTVVPSTVPTGSEVHLRDAAATWAL